MRTTEIRLNEIVSTNSEPIIDLSQPQTPNDFMRIDTIEEMLYNAIIDNYLWAFIIPQSTEAFIKWFQTYWNRNIIRYEPLVINQLTILENLYNGRSEKFKRDRTVTEKPDEQHDTTLTLGDTTTTKVNREYVRTPDLETNTNQTQFEQQTAETNETRTGTEKNTTKTVGDGDTVTRGGSNNTLFKKTGTNENILHDESETDVKVYDVDRFEIIARQTNVINSWIDEFAPLFNSILAVDEVNYGKYMA